MDIKRCTAGKNGVNQWHIACATAGASGLSILQNMKYTNTLSPQAISYYKAARWIVEKGGVSWTTNAIQWPTTASGLDNINPF